MTSASSMVKFGLGVFGLLFSTSARLEEVGQAESEFRIALASYQSAALHLGQDGNVSGTNQSIGFDAAASQKSHELRRIAGDLDARVDEIMAANQRLLSDLGTSIESGESHDLKLIALLSEAEDLWGEVAQVSAADLYHKLELIDDAQRLQSQLNDMAAMNPKLKIERIHQMVSLTFVLKGLAQTTSDLIKSAHHPDQSRLKIAAGVEQTVRHLSSDVVMMAKAIERDVISQQKDMRSMTQLAQSVSLELAAILSHVAQMQADFGSLHQSKASSSRAFDSIPH